MKQGDMGGAPVPAASAPIVAPSEQAPGGEVDLDALSDDEIAGLLGDDVTSDDAPDAENAVR